MQPLQAVGQPTKVIRERTRDPKEIREPLQCWKCVGPHLHRNCPLGDGNVRPTYNIQEVETVGQVARIVPRIYAALKDP